MLNGIDKGQFQQFLKNLYDEVNNIENNILQEIENGSEEDLLNIDLKNQKKNSEKFKREVRKQVEKFKKSLEDIQAEMDQSSFIYDKVLDPIVAFFTAIADVLIQCFKDFKEMVSRKKEGKIEETEEGVEVEKYKDIFYEARHGEKEKQLLKRLDKKIQRMESLKTETREKIFNIPEMRFYVNIVNLIVNRQVREYWEEGEDSNKKKWFSEEKNKKLVIGLRSLGKESNVNKDVSLAIQRFAQLNGMNDMRDFVRELATVSGLDKNNNVVADLIKQIENGPYRDTECGKYFVINGIKFYDIKESLEKNINIALGNKFSCIAQDIADEIGEKYSKEIKGKEGLYQAKQEHLAEQQEEAGRGVAKES